MTCETSFTPDFLYNVFELAPIGILIVNEQGEIEDSNEYMCTVTGYNRDELIGQRIETLVPDRYRAHHASLRDGYMQAPSNRAMGQNRELFCVTRNGDEVPIEVGLASVHQDDTPKVVVTVTDVTLKREAEKKLRTLSRELEEVSTPMLEVWDEIAVVPLIGTLDASRAQKLLETTLTRIHQSRYKVTILDITGLTGIDTSVADHLLRLAAAIRLMGGLAVVTGVSPEIAKTLVQLGVNLGELKTNTTLSNGLKYAIGHLEHG